MNPTTLVGQTVDHPKYPGAVVVAEYLYCPHAPCLVLQWYHVQVRVTLDSCKGVPKSLGYAPSKRSRASERKRRLRISDAEYKNRPVIYRDKHRTPFYGCHDCGKPVRGVRCVKCWKAFR